jgi:hypothetical protein
MADVNCNKIGEFLLKNKVVDVYPKEVSNHETAN